jgi:hypothetical protein
MNTIKFIASAIALLIVSLLHRSASAQSKITKSIKDFGAKGNGKTNDTKAFQKASDFFNSRNGHGVLLIPNGVYIVGEQYLDISGATSRPFAGVPVLRFANCTNMEVRGAVASKLRYKDSLHYGSFNPATKRSFDPGGAFSDFTYVADLSNCISFSNCNNCKVVDIECDGNSSGFILGGKWGDVGRQIAHYGIMIVNSKNIEVNKVAVHHFGLDGMCVTGSCDVPNNIRVLNSTFDYNGRQGLSWVGGNTLIVRNCKFRFTGQGKFGSSPGAGLDIEAESGHCCINGDFVDCLFSQNGGPAVAALSGPSSDMSFTRCVFEGTKSFALHADKPGYKYKSCKFRGGLAFIHITTDSIAAPSFTDCTFDDEMVGGRRPYGEYLVVMDGGKLAYFTRCTFNTRQKKAIWFGGAGRVADDKAVFTSCTFNVRNQNLAKGDFFAVIRSTRLQNNTFNYFFPKQIGYYLNDGGNIDLGGNKYNYR